MEPTEVRAQVLSDHAKLRSMLDEIDALTKRFAQDENVGGEIRDLGAALFEVFAAHLGLEDTLLAPALADLPASGPDLADRLKREHTEQRAMIRYLLRRLEEEDRPTALVANELQSFGDYLRRDMQHEEETILRAGLLGGLGG